MIRVVSSFSLGKISRIKQKEYGAILGISVGSREFSKEKIKSYLEFCLDNFDKTLIIIVDEIKKYNWMALENIDEIKATQKAMFEGNEMFLAVKRVIKQLQQEKNDVSKLTIIRWTEATKLVKNYDEVVLLLRHIFGTSTLFKKDVLKMTEKYLLTRFAQKTSKEQKLVATNFILEELSLFLSLGNSTKEKYCIDVYPGKFPVMENIITKKYPDFANTIVDDSLYGHIEVKF